MPDHTTTTTAPNTGAVEGTIEAYVATWNETDTSARRALIDEAPASPAPGPRRGAIAIR